MAECDKPTISFGFAKKVETKKLKKSAVGEGDSESKPQTDFILSLEDSEVKSSVPKQKEKEPYVIPLIKKNKWREGAEKRFADVRKESNQSELDQQAAKEVIADAANYNESWEDRDKPDPNLAIPLLMQNKVPEGFETDDKLDVGLRPDVPDDADYEQIPIEQFGFAMLRGMGWKEGEGIGKNGKVIAPVEAHLRPKGLGLGADRSQATGGDKAKKNDTKGDGKDEMNLEMKKGSYCVITEGKHKDLYGVIEGVDEDNARLVMKLTLSGHTVTITQYSVKLVSRKEYEKYSKYLNKGKVDRFKEDKSERKGNSPVSDLDRKDEGEYRHHKDERHRESDDAKSSNRKRKHDSDRDSSSKPSKDKSHHDSSSKSNSSVWLRPNLRVRIVDKHYKKGKYYKEKVIVMDVVSVDNAVCKTDDGRVLDGLSHSQLETVIPKNDSAHVMLCARKHKGMLGKIMKKDKSSCRALIQLLADRDTVLNTDFDEICEYVGSIDDEFDY